MADSITVKVGLNDTAFHAALGKAEKAANKFKSALGFATGALTVGGLAALGKSAIRTPLPRTRL